jgi:hypothetical protein
VGFDSRDIGLVYPAGPLDSRGVVVRGREHLDRRRHATSEQMLEDVERK